MSTYLQSFTEASLLLTPVRAQCISALGRGRVDRGVSAVDTGSAELGPAHHISARAHSRAAEPHTWQSSTHQVVMDVSP